MKALENNKDNLFLEFGVFQGKSINFFAKKIGAKKIYGFDSFVGLNEDWEGTEYPKGYFDLKGNLPKVEKNVILIKGRVQDTLREFIKEKNIKISFIHIDLDTYESTKFVLEELKNTLLAELLFCLMNYIIFQVGMLVSTKHFKMYLMKKITSF